MPRKTRKINGKMYESYVFYTRKLEARWEAQAERKVGNRACVLPGKVNGIKIWYVFRRKGKRG